MAMTEVARTELMRQIDETVGRVVLELRELIPEAPCVEGCHECCGPAPCTHWERERMGEPPAEGIAGMCEFLGPEGCTVYAERPMVCRLYGVIADLPCPHGARPRRRLSIEQSERIILRYRLAVLLDRLGHMDNACTIMRPEG